MAQTQVSYDRSPLHFVARRILWTARRTLPRRAYEALYSLMFWAYRSALRCAQWARMEAVRLVAGKEKYWRERVLYEIMPYSLVGRGGLVDTLDIVDTVEREHIAGALVECGVAQGGCSALMGLVSRRHESKRDMFLFDSFQGLPDPSEEDYESGETGKHIRPLERGSCLGTRDEVERLMFQRFEFNRDRVHLVEGWFQDTLPETSERVGTIAVLRIDGDWYESTRCCLDHLFDQVAPMGFVIVDDYASCHGARKATDEFLESRGLNVNLRRDGRGGASFRKPS